MYNRYRNYKNIYGGFFYPIASTTVVKPKPIISKPSLITNTGQSSDITFIDKQYLLNSLQNILRKINPDVFLIRYLHLLFSFNFKDLIHNKTNKFFTFSIHNSKLKFTFDK